MNLSPYVQQLREHLESAAEFGDDQTVGIARMLSNSLEPAARLAFMTALSDLADEVTQALDGDVVEVRIDGRDVRVSVTRKPGSDDAEAPGPTPQDAGPYQDADATPPPFRGFGGDMGGDISRITLRLVEQIKGQAERAAADQGMSLNSWVAQAVQGALSGNRPRGFDKREFKRAFKAEHDERRIRGWVQG